MGYHSQFRRQNIHIFHSSIEGQNPVRAPAEQQGFYRSATVELLGGEESEISQSSSLSERACHITNKRFEHITEGFAFIFITFH